MREIKFRGKRIDNGEWVYGSSIILQSTKGTAITEGAIDHTGRIVTFDVDPETVGQYTGIRDIYECDIVENGHVRGIVKLGNPDFKEGSQTSMFYVEVIKVLNYEIFTFEGDIWTEFNSFEKVGNIFQNPELLEVEE